MRKGTTPRYFTEEEKKAILYDYLQSGLSQRAIAFKYRLGDRSMLSNWLRQYESRKDLLPLSSKDWMSMARKDSQKDSVLELAKMKKEVERLRSELYNKDMEVKALNALIDVAEEHGVAVRKNSGAKQ
jgi:transposase-like protein